MTTEQHNKEQTQFKRNEELVKREVYACVTPMVEFIIKGYGNDRPFDIDDVENLYGNGEDADGFDSPDPEPQEVYEWWAVSPWLFEELKKRGEPVIDTFPHIWGRCTSGQAIALDSVISEIQREHKYAQGDEE
jgi:hypothetical protein